MQNEPSKLSCLRKFQSYASHAALISITQCSGWSPSTDSPALSCCNVFKPTEGRGCRYASDRLPAYTFTRLPGWIVDLKMIIRCNTALDSMGQKAGQVQSWIQVMSHWVKYWVILLISRTLVLNFNFYLWQHKQLWSEKPQLKGSKAISNIW